MRLDTSGNLGIGTTSPSTYGKMATLITGSGGAASTQTNSSLTVGATATGGVLNLGVDATSGFYSWIQSRNSGSASYYDLSLNPLGGSLLMGTTSIGGLGGLSFVPAGAGANTCFEAVWNASASTGNVATQFRYNGAGVGQITYTSTTTLFTNLSDYRAKENVQPMANALAKIAALKPVTYTWKLDGSEGKALLPTNSNKNFLMRCMAKKTQ
jgi:hypothetical protein